LSPAERPAPTSALQLRHTQSQLVFDLGGLTSPSGPGWESLPEASRAEAVAKLARLLARAGLEEESGA
jgi:hypothetical protein